MILFKITVRRIFRFITRFIFHEAIDKHQSQYEVSHALRRICVYKNIPIPIGVGIHLLLPFWTDDHREILLYFSQQKAEECHA